MTSRIVVSRSSAQGEPGQTFQDLHAQLQGAEPQLVVVFASSYVPLELVMRAARQRFPAATSIGCSTAGEFTGGAEGKGQFVAWALAGDDVTVSAGIGTGLKANPEAALTDAIVLPPEDSERPHRMAILLLDPLSGNGEETSMLAMTMLGPTVRLAGGAAGDDLAFKRTEVALGGQVANDAVVVAVLSSRKPLGIGVKHGHKPMSKPLTVTRAQDSVVHELDGRPAFQVWKESVREAMQAEGVDVEAIPPADLGAHLLRYEFGLIAGANEYKIRAPLSVDAAGAISFACGIPEGAVVRITSSREADQINAARSAAERAHKALGGAPVAGALIFDCICRNLILGPKFETAVNEIRQGLGGAPLAGFETYGEIAMDLGQSSGFHNTTTVVLAFPA